MNRQTDADGDDLSKRKGEPHSVYTEQAGEQEKTDRHKDDSPACRDENRAYSVAQSGVIAGLDDIKSAGEKTKPVYSGSPDGHIDHGTALFPVQKQTDQLPSEDPEDAKKHGPHDKIGDKGGGPRLSDPVQISCPVIAAQNGTDPVGHAEQIGRASCRERVSRLV